MSESKAVELLKRTIEAGFLRPPQVHPLLFDSTHEQLWKDVQAFLRTCDAAEQQAPDAMSLMREVEALTPGGSEFVMPDGWNNAIRFIAARMTQAAAIAKERNELRDRLEDGAS